MKKLLIFTAFLSISLISFSQNRTLPKVDLKTLDNNTPMRTKENIFYLLYMYFVWLAFKLCV